MLNYYVEHKKKKKHQINITLENNKGQKGLGALL